MQSSALGDLRGLSNPESDTQRIQEHIQIAAASDSASGSQYSAQHFPMPCCEASSSTLPSPADSLRAADAGQPWRFTSGRTLPNHGFKGKHATNGESLRLLPVHLQEALQAAPE